MQPSRHSSQPPQPEQDQTLHGGVPDPASTVPVATEAGVTPSTPHSPGASEHDFADEPLPEPDVATLIEGAFHAVIDRLLAISDHLAAIDHDMQDIAYRQGVITRHIRAITYHIEEEALP
jgi:hypothetical protein